MRKASNNYHNYIPSFSNVEAFGLLRLLTNVSSLNDDGIVPLQLQIHAYNNKDNFTVYNIIHTVKLLLNAGS